MDWGKAKTILIVALIVTNIFLILTYGVNKDKHGEVEDRQLLINFLAAKNIKVEKEIPKIHKDMPPLSVHYVTASDGAIKEALKDTTACTAQDSSDMSLMKTADAFIKSVGLPSNHRSFDGVVRTGDKAEVIYKSYADDIPLDDAYIKCIFQDARLTDFEYYWLEPEGFGKKKLPTISASVALISLANQQVGDEEIRVEDMQLVYWLDTNSFHGEGAITDTAFAAWRITYNGGNIYHIAAYEQQ